MMKVENVLSLLEAVAPVSLSDEFCKKYNHYDNSGIIVNSGKDISGILFSLDLSKNAIKYAKDKNCNLIVTHHPAIYGGISRFDFGDPVSENVAQCIKAGISVISMHLNFDCAPQGIDYHLSKGLGGKSDKVMLSLSNGGYGRVYDVEKCDFKAYVEKVKKEFCTSKVLAYNGGNDKISRVASFCGAGCDDDSIAFALKNKADVFVSSDMPHHRLCALLESGLSVIVLTHYASENYGFEKIYSKIKEGLKAPSFYFTDEGML